MDFNSIIRAKPYVARKLSEDLGSFVRAAWPTLSPGEKLQWNWHLDLICEHLMLVRERRIKRLLINVPPRTLKSTTASVAFPVWCWLRQPELRFLCVGYEIDLADSFNLARRRLIESPWFQSLFQDRVRLSSDRALVQEFTNAKGGIMLSASVSSRAAGRGGDIVLLDDILSPDVAGSEIYRNQTNDWLEYMLPQRLNDPASSPIVLIMQRLHQNDPAGYLLEKEPDEWTVLRLPLECEEDERWVFPISGRVVKRRAGECLHAKRFPPKVVEQRKKNRWVWASQFQQRPSPIEGNLVRVADIKYWGGKDPKTGERDPDLPESFDMKVTSVDASFKDKSTSDYVAMLTIGVKGSRRYVVGIVNSRMDLDSTENELRYQHSLHRPISAVLVEDKALGSAIISHLRDHIPGIVAVNPQGGKEVRLIATAPEFAAGNWFLPRYDPWTERLVEQLTLFPHAKHDDLADAVSQAAIWLQANSYSSEELPVITYYKREAAKAAKPAQARDDNQQQLKSSPEPCPVCGGVRIWMSQGQAVLTPHCNQCGGIGPARTLRAGDPCPVVGDDGKPCGMTLRSPSGGIIRCPNHGQMNTGEWQPVGCTFAQLKGLRKKGG
jgi:predicted phage terminase large subunit-like protein